MVSSFPNITPQQIVSLLKICVDSQTKDFNFLRSTYNNHNIGFDSVVKFMNKTNFIQIKDNRVILNKKLLSILDKTFVNINQVLLEQLLIVPNKYLDEIQQFFNSIKIDLENSTVNIDYRANYIFSNLRNFLTLLGLFIFNSIEKIYKINPDLNYFLVDYFDENGGLHPDSLNKIQLDEKLLGDKAELEIIKYERDRLNGYYFLVNKISHIALNNVKAGYDIKSYEVPNDVPGRIVPRYIEVKAVSLIDYSFYLSSNELNKASILKEKYYMYLLPVKTNSDFIIESLKIIQNPLNVLFDKGVWTTNIEKYKFSLTKMTQYES